MTNRWDQPGIPHKGWTCVGVEDLEAPDGCCDMCGKEAIRYVHYMEHASYQGTISAGCICAERMEDDYSAPGRPSRAKSREALLRNTASRKKRWLALNGWKQSSKGKPYITKDGYHIVVFPRGKLYSFKIERKASKEVYFSRGNFKTADEAKLSAFDAMNFLEAEEQGNRKLAS